MLSNLRIFCVMTYRSSCCFFFHFLLHLSLIHQFITLIVRFKMLFKRWFFVFFLCQTRLFAWQNRSQTLNGVPFEFWACVCFWICLWLIAIDEFHKLIDFWCAHTHTRHNQFKLQSKNSVVTMYGFCGFYYGVIVISSNHKTGVGQLLLILKCK